MLVNDSIFDIYADYLTSIAEKAPIVLIDCDLGKVFKSQRFQKKFPERYFNIGIAEQNAFSMAAGMAASGLIPIVQTFSAFVATRGCDQLRSSICYPNVGVILIGAKAGISDSYGGAIHQAIDDIGIISSIPNIHISCPSNSIELIEELSKAILNPKPYYIRIENNILVRYKGDPTFDDYKKVDLCVLSTGNMVNICREVVEELSDCGYKVHLESVTQLKPIDEKHIVEILSNVSKILVIELHNRLNGLGSLICQIAYKYALNEYVSIKTMAIDDHFTESGAYDDLLRKYHLDPYSIKSTVISLLKY